MDTGCIDLGRNVGDHDTAVTTLRKGSLQVLKIAELRALVHALCLRAKLFLEDGGRVYAAPVGAGAHGLMDCLWTGATGNYRLPLSIMYAPVFPDSGKMAERSKAPR
ncbi:hypothetical protein VTK73DRAFT_562 [Phialemonium thermophilum]|uniref:Uncharacterized protein n=1 Tax=Phialemonium thermophilum TaxID=223376 RepID=A0ABR3VUS2_9PEZI